MLRCSDWPRDNKENKSLANYSCCCKAYGLLTVFVAYHQLWTTHRIFRKLLDHLLMKIYNDKKHDQKTDLEPRKWGFKITGVKSGTHHAQLVSAYLCLAIQCVIGLFLNLNPWLIWFRMKINTGDPGKSLELMLKNPWKIPENCSPFLLVTLLKN